MDASVVSGPVGDASVVAPGVRVWPAADPAPTGGGLCPSWTRVEAAEQAAATAFLAQLDALLAVYDDKQRGIGLWWGLDDAQLVAEIAIISRLGEYAVERRLEQALTVRVRAAAADPAGDRPARRPARGRRDRRGRRLRRGHRRARPAGRAPLRRRAGLGRHPQQARHRAAPPGPAGRPGRLPRAATGQAPRRHRRPAQGPAGRAGVPDRDRQRPHRPGRPHPARAPRRPDRPGRRAHPRPAPDRRPLQRPGPGRRRRRARRAAARDPGRGRYP